jgi:hypothetical protein
MIELIEGQGISGADLNDAWFVAVIGRKDSTEIQVTGKYGIILAGGIGHYFSVRRVCLAHIHPVNGL